MAKVRTLLFSLPAFSMCLFAACSSTTLTASWKDEAYTGGPPSRMFIIGVAENEQRRRIFEDEFVRRLKERGTDALASYRIFDGEEILKRKVVEEKVRELGIDAVLVTRLVGSKTETIQYPGTTTYRGHYYGYYSRSYEITHRSPSTSTYEIASLQSNLFDTESGQLIWSASFETVLEGLAEDLIRSFVGSALESLVDERLVR